jgi:hypothetical protein
LTTVLVTAWGVFAVCFLTIVPPTVKLLRENWSMATRTERWRYLLVLHTLGWLAILGAIATVALDWPLVALFGAMVVLQVLALIETAVKVTGKRRKAGRGR